MINIINIRDFPELLENAADYFSSRWNIDRKLYIDSMNESLSDNISIPRWYLMLRDDDIIGGYGLIENDFMVSNEFSPWLCALYIEPHERGQKLGSELLNHSRYEVAKLGYDALYLNTDHIGYYEKYGWNYIGDFLHQSGENARVYKAHAIS